MDGHKAGSRAPIPFFTKEDLTKFSWAAGINLFSHAEPEPEPGQTDLLVLSADAGLVCVDKLGSVSSLIAFLDLSFSPI